MMMGPHAPSHPEQPAQPHPAPPRTCINVCVKQKDFSRWIIDILQATLQFIGADSPAVGRGQSAQACGLSQGALAAALVSRVTYSSRLIGKPLVDALEPALVRVDERHSIQDRGNPWATMKLGRACAQPGWRQAHPNSLARFLSMR